MNKTSKYTINGALLIGIANAVINAFNQLDNRQKNGQEVNWKKILEAFGKGALIGGVGGFMIGAIKDKQNTKLLTLAGGTAGYINEVLNSYENKSQILNRKAKQIQKRLNLVFGNQLTNYPFLSGSSCRGTDIKGSDIDIHVKFKNYVGSLEYLRNILLDFFDYKFNDSTLVHVRNQTCSIGLFFKLYNKEYRIDIVPTREIRNGAGDVFLYVESNSLFQHPTVTKTNPNIHRNELKFTQQQKNIIKLLKGWKQMNEIDLPSIYLELLVKKAFANLVFTKRIDENLLKVIEFIGNNISNTRLVDPANCSNVISDHLTKTQKDEIELFCSNMINSIVADKRNIIDYLPFDEN